MNEKELNELQEAVLAEGNPTNGLEIKTMGKLGLRSFKEFLLTNRGGGMTIQRLIRAIRHNKRMYFYCPRLTGFGSAKIETVELSVEDEMDLLGLWVEHLCAENANLKCENSALKDERYRLSHLMGE